jgi:hypothetical protein
MLRKACMHFAVFFFAGCACNVLGMWSASGCLILLQPLGPTIDLLSGQRLQLRLSSITRPG